MTDNSNSNPKSNPNNSPDLFFNKVDINVEKLYNDTLQKIDQIRSYVVVSSVLINKNINLNKQDFDEILKKNIKKERTPQESRCHAYYRLLGLPAVDKDGYGYNPGFDKDNNSNSNFLKRKLSTFNNIDPKLINLMSKREDYNSNYFTKFFKFELWMVFIVFLLTQVPEYDF